MFKTEKMQLDGVVEQFEDLGLKRDVVGEVWQLEGIGFTQKEPDEEDGFVAGRTTRPRKRQKKAEPEVAGAGKSVLSKALQRRLALGKTDKP